MNTNRNGAPMPNRPGRNTKRVPAARKNRRRKNTVLISVGIFVVVLAVILLVLWRIVDTYEPSMNTGIGRDTGESGEMTDGDTSEGEVTTEDSVEVGAPQAVPSPFDRKEGFYTMLVVGHDAVAVNTDVIMVIAFDTVKGDVSVLQIPRDTYVEINGYSHKINSVFAIMRNTREPMEADRISSGMEGLANVIGKGLGIPIDFWAMVDLGGFVGIVDAIGGVEIDLPSRLLYNDPEQDLYIDLQPGHQKLTGAQAEQFVRFRMGYVQADLGRLDAQKIFLSALARQVKASINISNVAKLVEKTIDMVDTDMSLLDCVYFGRKFLEKVDFENINFVTLPIAGVSPYVVMRRADTLTLMNAFFNPYTVDMTESTIDPQHLFTSEVNEGISTVYFSNPTPDLLDTIHSAGDINEEGIYIPMTGRYN